MRRGTGPVLVGSIEGSNYGMQRQTTGSGSSGCVEADHRINGAWSIKRGDEYMYIVLHFADVVLRVVMNK